MVQRTVLVFLLLIAVLAPAMLSFLAWWNRRQPGIYWFAVHSGFVAVWVFATLTSLVADTEATTIWFGLISNSLTLGITLSWFLFIITYLGYGPRLPERFGTVTVFGVGAAYVALYLVPFTRQFLATDIAATQWSGFLVYNAESTPVSTLVLAIGLVLFLAGLSLLFQRVVTGNRFHLVQAALLATAISLPLFAGLILGFAPALPRGAPVPQVAIVSSICLYVFALQRYDFFELTPATERIGIERAFESLGVGILIAGRDGTVLETNKTGCAVFDRNRGQLLGRRVDDLLETLAVEPDSLPAQVEIENRYYWITESPVTDDTDTTIGRSVLCVDVTDQRLSEQRIDVLDRILRHNIRNKLNVVTARVTMAIERSDDEQLTEMLAEADGAARELLSSSDKAREFEVAVQSATRETVALGDLVEECRHNLTDVAGETAVQSDIPTDIALKTNRRLLALVISNSLESALVHGTADTTVRVSASQTPDGVAVEIVDDGPAIPAHEIAAINDGEETQLSHSSGIGLWLVRWAVPRLGGHVTFQQREPGTQIKLTVPDQSVTEPAESTITDYPATID